MRGRIRRTCAIVALGLSVTGCVSAWDAPLMEAAIPPLQDTQLWAREIGSKIVTPWVRWSLRLNRL